MKQNAATFARIEQTYGVPAPVIVAIWGLETDFGAGSGNLAALHETNGFLAEAYAATRLLGTPHTTFGACDLHVLQSLVLCRVLPS